ncbi:zinc finger protein 629-like [Anopheles bellator]|uniref:zinc finger protein 629-like n=1 Tax=Anopheles bellator TaxID=139047 RepID=UPI00264777B1|nr:zinc finger protein 629-like [Anopheles bellator]
MDDDEEVAIEITVSNLNTCCITCLISYDDNDCVELADSYLTADKSVPIVDALKKVTNIDVSSNESLPTRICGSCLERLDGAYCFIRDACVSRVILQDYLRTKDDGYRLEQDQQPDDTNTFNAQDEAEVADDGTQTEDPNDMSAPTDNGSDAGSDDENTVDEINAVNIIRRRLKTETGRPRSSTTPEKGNRKRNARPRTRYKCDECNYTFARSSNLVDHKRLHMNVKLFSCDYCDKSFVQVGNLKTHMRTHTCEKPYVCPLCEKAYTQSSSLKTHMNSHINNKPHACDTCEKAFTNSSDLTKHKATHRKEKQYMCTICENRYFTQKVHLRSHLLRMHPRVDLTKYMSLGNTVPLRNTV